MTHAILTEIQNTLDEAAANYALQIRKLTSLVQESKALTPPSPKLAQAKQMRTHFRKASDDITALMPEAVLTESNTKRLEEDVAKLRKRILTHSRKRRYSVRDIPDTVNPTDGYGFIIVDSFEAIKKPLPTKIYLTKKDGLWWYIVTPRPTAKPVLTPTALSAAKNISRHTVVSALFAMRKNQTGLSEKLKAQIQRELTPESKKHQIVLTHKLPQKRNNDTIYIWHDSTDHLGAWQYIITPSSNKPEIKAPRQLKKLSTIRDDDVLQLAKTRAPSLAFAVCKRDLIEAIVPGNNTYMTLQHLKRTALKARKIAGKDATSMILSPIAKEFLQDLLKFTNDQRQPDQLLVALYNYVNIIEKSKSTGKEGESASLACDVLLHALRELPKKDVITLYQKLKPVFKLIEKNEQQLTNRITNFADNDFKHKRFLLRTQHWVHMEHFKVLHFGMSKNLKNLSTSIEVAYREVTGLKTSKLISVESKAGSTEKLATHYENFIQNLVINQYDELSTSRKQELKLNAAVKKLLSDISSSAGNWFSWLLDQPNQPGFTWSFNPNRVVRSLQSCHRIFLECFPNEEQAKIDQLFTEILNTHLVEMHLDHPKRFNRLQHILHSQEYYEFEKTARSCSESITGKRQAPINDLSKILDMVRQGSENIPGAEKMTKLKRRMHIQAHYVTTIKKHAKTAMELTHYRTLRR